MFRLKSAQYVPWGILFIVKKQTITVFAKLFSPGFFTQSFFQLVVIVELLQILLNSLFLAPHCGFQKVL